MSKNLIRYRSENNDVGPSQNNKRRKLKHNEQFAVFRYLQLNDCTSLCVVQSISGIRNVS